MGWMLMAVLRRHNTMTILAKRSPNQRSPMPSKSTEVFDVFANSSVLIMEIQRFGVSWWDVLGRFFVGYFPAHLF
jgi:hypothetical protein